MNLPNVNKAVPNTTIVLTVMGVAAVVGAYFLLKDTLRDASKELAAGASGAWKASRIGETPGIVKTWLDDMAEAAGYQSATASNEPQLEYARQRSAFARARNVTIDQASALGWPDFATWRSQYNMRGPT